jgi:glycosyltransferase involved in cell wall biosynthesis
MISINPKGAFIMNDIKFSIGIAVYNAELYLGDCLESIVEQIYDNYEVILVDDGSSDQSGLICDAYAKKYDKFIVVHKENAGALMARRTVLNYVSGDYIIMMDSDDALRNDALALIANSIADFNCDMLVYNASRVSTFDLPYRRYNFIDGQVFEGKNKEILYSLLIRTGSFNNLWNKVVKTELWDFDHDYSEFRQIIHSEDKLQLMPLITQAKKIVYIDENLYFYRDNANSITKVARFEQYTLFPLLCNEMCYYIKLWGLEDEVPYYYANLANLVCDWLSVIPSINDKRSYNIRRAFLVNITSDDFFKVLIRQGNLSYLSLQKKVLCYILCLNKPWIALLWDRFIITLRRIRSAKIILKTTKEKK